VPSIDRGHPRSCASRNQSRVRSRDGFPLRPGPRRPFGRSRRAALSRPLAGYGLDPRPRTLPKSGEMESARFSESDAAYRFLQRLRQRRASTSLERSILTRHERAALLEPSALCVCPRFRAPLSKSPHAMSPPPSRRAGSEPHRPHQRSPPGVARTPKGGTPKAAALRNAACGRRYDPATGCADDGLKRRR